MARPTINPQDRRSVRLQLTVTQDEYERILADSKKARKTVSDFLRDVLIRKPLPAAPAQPPAARKVSAPAPASAVKVVTKPRTVEAASVGTLEQALDQLRARRKADYDSAKKAGWRSIGVFVAEQHRQLDFIERALAALVKQSPSEAVQRLLVELRAGRKANHDIWPQPGRKTINVNAVDSRIQRRQLDIIEKTLADLVSVKVVTKPDGHSARA